MLSSGGTSPEVKHVERPGTQVEAAYGATVTSIVGLMGRILADEASQSYYPRCTLGGVILVGDTFYAITTAHSLFREPSAVDNEREAIEIPAGPAPSNDLSISAAGCSANFKVLGTLNFFRWGEPRSRQDCPSMNNAGGKPAADWALVKIMDKFLLPNLFQDPEHPGESISINAYETDEENFAGDVWLCCGITGIQRGYLNGNPASVAFGKAIFNAYSIAVEHALGTQ